MTPDQQKLRDAQLANNKELEDIQKPRKVGQKVGLGVIHDDLKKINETLGKTKSGSDPTAGRQPLPKYSVGGQKLDPRNPNDAKLIKLIQESETAAESTAAPDMSVDDTGADNTAASADEDRVERLNQIGAVIQAKLNNQPKNQTQSSINASVFSNFVEQTKNRENLLKDATEEQKQIFADLENAIIDLREASGEESDELRKTLAALQGTLSATESTTAKGSIENIISAARTGAAAPSLKGIAQSALSGDFTGAIRKTGQYGMSKIDNLGERWFGESSQRPTERSTELGALLKALKEMNSGRSTAPDRTSRTAKKLEAKAVPGSSLADAKIQPSGPPEIRIDLIDVLNVKAKTVNLEGDIEIDGAMMGGPGIPGGLGDVDKNKKKQPPKKPSKQPSKPSKPAIPVGKFGKLFSGLGLLMFSADVGEGSDIVPHSMMGEKEKLQFEHEMLQKEMYNIVTKPNVSPEERIKDNERIKVLNKRAADLVTQINAVESKSKAVPADAIKTVPKDQGSTVQQQSQHNDQLRERERKPVVIVPPATVQPQANNSNTQVLMPVSGVRPTENAYVRYVNRGSTFV